MLTKRMCGPCTACCKAIGVTELTKPAGKECLYCILGKGCAIYDSRPKGCQAFECQWLMGDGLEEERPDTVGFVVDHQEGPNILFGDVIVLWENKEGALSSREAERAVRRYKSRGFPVHQVFISGRKIVRLPLGYPVQADYERELKKRGYEVVFH